MFKSLGGALVLIVGLLSPISNAGTSGPTCTRIRIAMCSNGVLPYNETAFPNSLGHGSQDEAESQIATYQPLVQVECSSYLREYLCRAFLPECKRRGQVVPTCRNLCERARDDCSDLMTSFGFAWPDMLDCSRHPTNNCNDVISGAVPNVTPLSTTTPVAVEGTCEPVRVSMCTGDAIPYNSTTFPNMLGHNDQDEAGLEIHQFYPLVKVLCSEYLQEFLCRVYVPECSSRGLPFCRNLCEQSKNGCFDLMSRFGFAWPEPLECSRFPNDNCDDRVGAPSEMTSLPATTSSTPSTNTSPRKLNRLLKKSMAMALRMIKSSETLEKRLLQAEVIKKKRGGTGLNDYEEAVRILKILDWKLHQLTALIGNMATP